jgi:hypothetical protein
MERKNEQNSIACGDSKVEKSMNENTSTGEYSTVNKGMSTVDENGTQVEPTWSLVVHKKNRNKKGSTTNSVYTANLDTKDKDKIVFAKYHNFANNPSCYKQMV